jgi:hypothetical protein
VLDNADSNMGGFFVEMHVFLQMIWMRLFVTKWAFLDLEIAKLQLDSFHILTQVTQGNNVLEAPASKTDVFLSRHTRLLNWAE